MSRPTRMSKDHPTDDSAPLRSRGRCWSTLAYGTMRYSLDPARVRVGVSEPDGVASLSGSCCFCWIDITMVREE
ncbi:MAG: hypothetical protein AAGF95_18105 [Chloroflexota bacterium]